MARLVALEISIPVGSGRAVARVGVFAKATALTSEDAEDLVKKVREVLRSSLHPIHALIVAAPSIDEEALQKLEAASKELSLELAIVRIPRVIDRVRLAAVGRAIEEASQRLGVEPFKLALDMRKLSDVLDVEVAEAVLRDVVEGLSIVDKLRGVAREPIAITEPILSGPLKKHEDLVDAMKWLLYSPWNRARVSDFYSYVRDRVARFHIFKKKRGLLSLDIESLERFREAVATLARNGFVKYDPESDVVELDMLSPLEERFLRILDSVFDGVASLESMRRFFVDVSINSERVWSAIISILELRGLICIESGEGLCPDAPGKGYVVSLRGERSAKYVATLLERARGFAAKARHLAAFGYVVSGKERGYRAFTLEEMVEFVEELAAKAEEVLSVDASMAVRLARLCLDLAEYGEKAVLPEVSSAREAMESVLARLRDAINRIEEGVRSLEDLLKSYVASNSVEISFGLLNELRKGYERARKLVDEAIPRERFLEEVENLWRSSKGRNFPFHFAKLGPVYHFNYKLYLLHRELKPFVEIGGDGTLSLSEVVSDAVAEVDRAVKYVKDAIEKVVGVGSLSSLAKELESCETLRELAKFVKEYRMARISVEPISVSSAPELFKAVKRVVDEWLKSVEEDARMVSDIASIAREVAKLEREASERCKSIARRVEVIAGILERCPTVFSYSASCSSELDHVKELIESAVETIRKLGRGEAPVFSLREVRDRARDVREALRKVVSELREEKLENCSKLLEEVRKRVGQLVASARTLSSLLSKLRIEVPTEYLSLCSAALERVDRGDYVAACELIPKLSRVVEEMKRLAMVKGLLSVEELEVFTAISEIKAEAKGVLSLDEAIAILVERLGIPYERVRRLVIGLIDKGVIEVYI